MPAQVRFLRLLDELITPSAQRTYKKAIFVFILEILNQESEDTFFTLRRNDEKANRASRARKRPPREQTRPSELAPLANAKECYSEDETPTLKESAPATALPAQRPNSLPQPQ